MEDRSWGKQKVDKVRRLEGDGKLDQVVRE